MRDEISRIGCFFKSCLAIAEMDVGKYFSLEDHSRIWDICKQFGYINKEDNIKMSANIISLAYRKLGVEKQVIEVGTSASGFYPWVMTNKKFQDVKARIQKIEQNGPSKTHFRLVDKEGKLLWDPHQPEIHCIKPFYTIWYYIGG